MCITILYLNKQKSHYRKFCLFKQVKCGFKSLFFFSPSPYRITTTAACMMDLRRYPLDEQNCTLEIESCKLLEGEGWPNDSRGLKDLHRLGKTGASCSNTVCPVSLHTEQTQCISAIHKPKYV